MTGKETRILLILAFAGVALSILALPLSAAQTEPPVTLHKKQTPGGPLDGDVGAIKDRDGMVIIWNRSRPYFTMKVVGEDVSGFGDEAVYFSVDDVFLQVLSVEVEAFVPKGVNATSEKILEAHRDWDFRNMQRSLGEKSVLRSSLQRLTDGTPVLYWEVTPEKKLGPSRYLMMTRVQAGSVIGATSVAVGEVTLERAKALVSYAISHVEFFKSPIDMEQFRRALASQP